MRKTTILWILALLAMPTASASEYYLVQDNSSATCCTAPDNCTIVDVWLNATDQLYAGFFRIVYDADCAEVTSFTYNDTCFDTGGCIACPREVPGFFTVGFSHDPGGNPTLSPCTPGLAHLGNFTICCNTTTPPCQTDLNFGDGTGTWDFGGATPFTVNNGTFTCSVLLYTINGSTTPAADNVTIKNLFNGKVFEADINGTGFYTRELISGVDVNDSETLEIVADKALTGDYCPENYTYTTNVTRHVVNIAGDTVDLTLSDFRINFYPKYKWFTQNAWNYSGAAVLQMWADFKDLSYTQDQLQAWGLANNTPNEPDDMPYIDPWGMAQTLNKLPLSGNPHFTVGKMANTSAGLSYAMHRICWWQYLGPGALPTGGYYDKWMSVRGIHTDRNPHDGTYGGYGDWEYNVTGFWINDPCNLSQGGIGANSYKTALEWNATYYKEIIDENNTAYPYDYNHKYITVLEPPEHDAVVGIAPAKPRLDRAVTPVMVEKAVMVYDVEQLAVEKMPEDDDSLKIVAAAIDGVSEELIPYDHAFAEVFAKTTAGEPMLVADDGSDYYLVPFNVPVVEKPFKKMPIEIERVKVSGDMKLERVKRMDAELIIEPIPIEPIKVERTLVVVLVDAEDGSFKETSWVEDPVKYLPVSKEEALKLALGEVQIQSASDLTSLGSKPTIELVHRDTSPYYPDWKITVDGTVFYVSQEVVVSS